MRKTINVQAVKNFVNEELKDNVMLDQKERYGMIRVLEMVLSNTKNYDGYVYLSEHDLRVGQTPGFWSNGGSSMFPARFENTDETRREYS